MSFPQTPFDTDPHDPAPIPAPALVVLAILAGLLAACVGVAALDAVVRVVMGWVG